MKLHVLATALLIVACSHTAPVFVEKHPDTGTAPPDPMSDDPLAQRGQYLVTLLGCGSCHTDGALTGQANSKLLLAGSRTGIAISNPLKVEHPGMVFPPKPHTGQNHRARPLERNRHCSDAESR